MAKEGNDCRLSIGVGKLKLLRSRSLLSNFRHWEGSQSLGRHPRIQFLLESHFDGFMVIAELRIR
jgi:hypothetical protein